MYKKGLFIISFILFALVLVQEPNVHASKAIIQVDHLNVRNGPGTDFKRIGQVHSDQVYSIIEEKNNWVKINWNNQKGWIAKWLTKIKTEEQASSNDVFTSKVNYLRIRSAPGLDSKIKGYLMENDKVEVQDKNGSWALIHHQEIKGWVHSDYLTTQAQTDSSTKASENEGNSNPSVKGKITVGTDLLNVRNKNSINGDVLTQVQRGQVYEYIDEKNRWIHIKLKNGETGWVASWLVNKNQNDTSDRPSYVKLKYNGTNIRNGPSTSNEIVGRAQKGNQFNVLEKQGQWYKIRYNNQAAYVASWIVDEYSKDSSSSPSGNLNGKTIMLDAGHGGKDSGAIGHSGSYEKTLTLQTADRLKKQLENMGAQVLMTRERDEYISLSIRTYYSNHSNIDAFISLHYNSAPSHVNASGISSYYYHSKNKKLAASIQSEMVEFTNLRNRNVHFGNFHVLRENNKPSVLLELGFVSNSREEETVRGAHYQTQVSRGIAQGLIRYFN